MAEKHRTLQQRSGVVIAILATALGCASSYYDEYAAAHPGFVAELPREGVGLREVLASLYAPPRSERIEVEVAALRIYRTDVEPWREIPFASIREGEVVPATESDYAVLVAWTCRFEQGLNTGGSERNGHYLLPGDRLHSYDHYEFRDECETGNEFRAARGPRAEVEREVMERTSGAGTRFTLEQAYARGLAYVEAGRLGEARAMLLVGERGYRQVAAKLRAAGRPGALSEVERMRASLMRALGVEERRDGATPGR